MNREPRRAYAPTHSVAEPFDGDADRYIYFRISDRSFDALTKIEHWPQRKCQRLFTLYPGRRIACYLAPSVAEAQQYLRDDLSHGLETQSLTIIF